MTPSDDVGADAAATHADPLYVCQLLKEAKVTLPFVLKSPVDCAYDFWENDKLRRIANRKKHILLKLKEQGLSRLVNMLGLRFTNTNK